MANPSLQIGNDNWAIKEDNLLGYSTAGTRFVPQPITMTRASAGTRVNSSGLVETVELLGSELVDCGNFECASPESVWGTGTGWSIANGLASYDGSGGTQSVNQAGVVESSKTYKLTLDVVSNEGSGINTIYLGGVIVSNIHLEVGNYIFFVTTSSTASLAVFGRSGEKFVIDNISVKESTKNNLARVDYTDGTSSLLVEPQRTNYNPKSEDIDTWSANGVLREKNYTSPDGTLNAVKITDNSVNSTHRVLLGITTPSSGDFTYSVFLKKGTMTDAVLNVYSGGTVGIGTIDLENGTIVASGGGVNAKIEDYGNDWYRCSIGGTLANTSTTIYLYLSDSKNAYIGNGDFLYMAFAQLEQGSYATSYIPTSGSTVTRNQDIFTRDGIGSLIGQTEGTFFIELSKVAEKVKAVERLPLFGVIGFPSM